MSYYIVEDDIVIEGIVDKIGGCRFGNLLFYEYIGKCMEHYKKTRKN